jgi:hypothetical protein
MGRWYQVLAELIPVCPPIEGNSAEILCDQPTGQIHDWRQLRPAVETNGVKRAEIAPDV